VCLTIIIDVCVYQNFLSGCLTLDVKPSRSCAPVLCNAEIIDSTSENFSVASYTGLRCTVLDFGFHASLCDSLWFYILWL